jgi:GTP cyclohydrolase IA
MKKYNKEEIKEILNNIIESVGDDPKREGLLDTPRRVVESYSEILNGYGKDPKENFIAFETDYTGMILFNDIKFYSLCEHHFLPIIGTAVVGIIPSKKTRKVIGFNKITKIVDIFAHRLQMQETLTKQITDCLNELLEPEGVMVSTTARHLCAEMKGTKIPPHNVVCTDYRGCFKDEKLRQEFYQQQNLARRYE